MVTHGGVTAREALSYAMSLPVATTISGIDSLEVLEQNLGIARNFKPLASEQMGELRERCRENASDGRLELFKMSKKYDGAEGRKQHQFPNEEELPV